MQKFATLFMLDSCLAYFPILKIEVTKSSDMDYTVLHLSDVPQVRVSRIIIILNYRNHYKYYVSGHYPSSCFYLKHLFAFISKHNVSETGLCPRNVVFWKINRTVFR
jgi:hypothetical protein